MDWMILPLKRYAQFHGRSRRLEYWMFVVFNILIAIAFAVLSVAVGGIGAVTGDTTSAVAAGGLVGIITIINLIVSLAFLIPSIAVAVRRLHDINRSGWWLLAPALGYAIGFAALFSGGLGAMQSGGAPQFGAAMAIGGIFILVGGIMALALFVFFLLPGTTGPNRFGPDPKNPEANLESVFS